MEKQGKINLVGISGKQGSGKDEVTKMIQYLAGYCKRRPDNNRSYQSWKEKVGNDGEWKNKKFSYKLKQIASVILGIPTERFERRELKNSKLPNIWSRYIEDNFESDTPPVEESLTVREFLQRLGEGVRKTVHEDFWINALFNSLELPQVENTIDSWAIPVLINIIPGTSPKKAKYKCSCGKEFVASIYHVNSGHTRSCGCYQKKKAAEVHYIDGRKGTRLWAIFNNMHQRCEYENHPSFVNYGGRGITICKEWKTFEEFKKWAYKSGYSDNLTIDRINNEGNYYPENCRWVIPKIQNINQRIRKDNKSGYRGVTKDGNVWRASIQINKERKIIGWYKTPQEASLAYNREVCQREDLYELENNKKVSKSFGGVIISDVRYLNEIGAIRRRGGVVIRIDRNYSTVYGESGIPATYSHTQFHESETSLDKYNNWDYTIENNGTLEELKDKVEEMLKHFGIINSAKTI